MIHRCSFCQKLIFRGEPSMVDARNYWGDPTSHIHARCSGKKIVREALALTRIRQSTDGASQ